MILTLEEQERLAADWIRRHEAAPDGSLLPRLLFADGKGLRDRAIRNQANTPAVGQGWMELDGSRWVCKSAFTVHDSIAGATKQVRFMVPEHVGLAAEGAE